MEQKTRVRKPMPKKINWWMWAFIALVLVILGTGIYGYSKLSGTPNEYTETTSMQPSTAQFTINLDKKQINAITNRYLTKLQQGKAEKYSFKLGDQAILAGSTKILGFNVKFTMDFMPETTKSGNILLKATGLHVGVLSLPVSTVLTYAQNNFKVPNWVHINSHKQTVLLDLNKFSQGQTLQYSAQTINLANDEFIFKVRVPR